MNHRNPYAILAISFGASREEANVAFARRARQLRRLGPDGRSQMTDLTWALNQVDEAIRNPEAAMDIYRIPANPDAFTVAGIGVMTPAPEPLAPRTTEIDIPLTQLKCAAAWEYLRTLVVVRAAQTPVPRP